MLDPDADAVNVTSRYHPGWVAHGLVASTAADLVRFLDALVSGGVVGPQSLEEMLIAIPVGETHPWMTEPSYGLGLMIDPANRFGVVAGHTGGGPGYSTAAYHFPDVAGRRVTSVALVNRDGSDIATDIVFSMAECSRHRS
jgi:D-alanyl-D-alanine carboxypeptidase